MKRKTAREIAVRLCFMLSENPRDAAELLDEVFEPEYYETLGVEDSLFKEAPSEQLSYITEIIKGIGLHNAELDEYVMRYAEGWSFERISRTALAIMKVAMYEILYMSDIPVGVSVNEAVELAKQYEEEETVPFINGLLGSFIKGEVNS